MAINLVELRLVVCALALSLATVLVPCAGFAQQSDDKAQAQKMYKQGAEAFYQSDYPQAILFFRRAYQLDPNAMPLYNIAVAYGKLGNIEEAYKAGIEARDEGGLPKGVLERNEGRIQAFSLILTSRRLADGDDVAASPRIDDADVSESRKDEVSGQKGVSETDSQPIEEVKAPSGGRSMSALGWAGAIGVGVGAAGLGLAGYYALEVDQAQADFDDSPAPTHTERVEHADEINEMRERGRLSLYAGAALAAVGLALLTYDLVGGEDPGADAAHVSAVASSAPGGASVELRIDF